MWNEVIVDSRNVEALIEKGKECGDIKGKGLCCSYKWKRIAYLLKGILIIRDERARALKNNY